MLDKKINGEFVMKKLIFIPLLLTLFACGKSEEEKKQDKVDDAEDKITKLNEISQTLANKGVTLSDSYSYFGPSPDSIAKKVSEQSYKNCTEISGLLADYKRIAGEVLDVAAMDGVYYADSYKLRQIMNNASTIYQGIKCKTQAESDEEQRKKDLEIASKNKVMNDAENAKNALESKGIFKFVERGNTVSLVVEENKELNAKILEEFETAVNFYVEKMEALKDKLDPSSNYLLELKLVKGTLEKLHKLTLSYKVKDAYQVVEVSLNDSSTEEEIKERLEKLRLLKNLLNECLNNGMSEYISFDNIETVNKEISNMEALLSVKTSPSPSEENTEENVLNTEVNLI